jgi:hypothetical protein
MQEGDKKMKKVMLLILGAVIFFGAFAVSCSSDKKKKITSDTAVIITDPDDLSDGIGYSSSVVIIGRISTDSSATISRWTISNSALGTINGSTIAVNTNSITYATPSGGDAAGIISAYYDPSGLRKDIKVAIGTCAVNISTGGSGNAFNGYKMYSDIGFAAIIKPAVAVYSGADWNLGDSMLLEGKNEGIPGVPASYTQPFYNIDDHNDGFKMTYTRGTASGTHYGGVTIEFNTTQTLSEYTKVCFWAKGQSGGEILHVYPADRQVAANNNVLTLTDDWAKYELDFVDVNMSSVNSLITFLFKDDVGSVSSSIYIDFIYLQ